MRDNNGLELRCGDIVRIVGSYFKFYNGLYFVVQDGHNPARLSTRDELILHRIGATGKVSKGKYHITFWPLPCFVHSLTKTAKAFVWNQSFVWNQRFATITKVKDVPCKGVLEWLEAEAKKNRESIEVWKKLGYGPSWYKPNEQSAAYFKAAVKRLQEE